LRVLVCSQHAWIVPKRREQSDSAKELSILGTRSLLKNFGSANGRLEHGEVALRHYSAMSKIRTTTARLAALGVIAAIVSGPSPLLAEVEDAGGKEPLTDYRRSGFSSGTMSNILADIIADSILDGTYKYHKTPFLPDDPSEWSDGLYPAQDRAPLGRDQVTTNNISTEFRNGYIFLSNTRIPAAVSNINIPAPTVHDGPQSDENISSSSYAESWNGLLSIEGLTGDLDEFLEQFGIHSEWSFSNIEHICTTPHSNSDLPDCIAVNPAELSSNGSIDDGTTSYTGSTNLDSSVTAVVSSASPFRSSNMVYVVPFDSDEYDITWSLGCVLSDSVCLPIADSQESVEDRVSSAVEGTPSLGPDMSVPPPPYFSSPPPVGTALPEFPTAQVGASVPEASSSTLMLLALVGIVLAFAKRPASHAESKTR
jgi:hypothetical protein